MVTPTGPADGCGSLRLGVDAMMQAMAPTAEETDRAIAGFQAFAANGRRRQQEAGQGDAAAMCTAELAEQDAELAKLATENDAVLAQKDAELAEKDAAHAVTNVQMAELTAEKDAKLVKLAAEKDAEIEALRLELLAVLLAARAQK